MLHIEHQKTALKSGLTPQQRQEMRLWLLTKGKRGKSHTSVLYSWYDPDDLKRNGHNAFLVFSQTPLYKKWIGESEERFMHTYAERIAKQIPQWTQQLVEMGPGNDKMQTYMRFLCTFQDRSRLQYRPADVAKSALDDGLADAEKAGFGKGAPILGDRDNPVTFSQVQDAFYVCFGGGFVNSYDQIPQRISHMQGSGYIHRGRVFSTFFGMPGDDSMGEDNKVLLLKAIYGDMGTQDKPNNFGEQESYDKARDMILQPFEALGFDTNKLDLGVERIQGDPNKIVLGARVIKSFIETEGDEEYLYSTGDFIPLIDSPRPTLDQYTTQIQKGGGKVRDIFSYNGVVGSIVELPRKQFSEKIKRRAKNIGFIIAGTVALNYGTHEYGKYAKLRDAREYALQEMSYKNIEYPLHNVLAFPYGSKTNDNANYETRLERLDFITDQVFDIIHTEYKGYDFPDDDVLKAAIMRFIPDNLDYFTKSSGPDEHFFAFVNNVFMPYLFSWFGNEKNTGLYQWAENDEIITLINDVLGESEDLLIKEFKDNMFVGNNAQKILRKDKEIYLYEVTNIAYIFMPNDDGVFEKIQVGYLTPYYYVGPSYRSEKGHPILLAGDDKNGFSVSKAHRVVEFINEKGYASNLTNQILSLLDPVHKATHHETVKKELFEYIVSMNKKGFDFSWLCKGNKKEEMKRFIGGFLLHTGTSLDHDIHCLLKESGVKEIHELFLSEQVDKMVEFLKVYYGQHKTGIALYEKKDYIGVRNFLMQVVCTGYLDRLNSFFSRYDEPLVKGNMIRTLRRLSNKLEEFGFDVQENKNAVFALKMLYDDYDYYKNKGLE